MAAILKRRFPQLLRLSVHLGGILPVVFLVRDALADQLTANPYQEAEQRTGETALILLLFSLACTPLSILFGFTRAVKHRRALGLYAFFYASLHLFIFSVLDYGLDWAIIWETVVEKRFIFVGLAAFLCLLALAVTSFRWWMKRMGKNWTRLHRIVYLAGGLVILHFAWVVKGDVLGLSGSIAKPILYGVILALLLAVRIPPLRRAIVRFRRSIEPRRVRTVPLAPQEPVRVPTPAGDARAGDDLAARRRDKRLIQGSKGTVDR
jgi:sulfoxide reductase heme-binding subunit YedZ